MLCGVESQFKIYPCYCSSFFSRSVIESTQMKMIAQPSKIANATKCCWRNDAKSTSSSMAAGGDADGGGAVAAGTNRGRIVRS